MRSPSCQLETSKQLGELSSTRPQAAVASFSSHHHVLLLSCSSSPIVISFSVHIFLFLTHLSFSLTTSFSYPSFILRSPSNYCATTYYIQYSIYYIPPPFLIIGFFPLLTIPNSFTYFFFYLIFLPLSQSSSLVIFYSTSPVTIVFL